MRSQFRPSVGLGVLVVALALAAAPARSITISDGIASITADNTHGGLTAFVTGGTDHLYQSEYYYRTDAMTQENRLVGFGTAYVTSVSSPDATTITVLGSTPELDFKLDYRLNNGVLVPEIEITNTTASQYDLSIFNYQDWDVDGSANGDRLAWDGAQMTISQVGNGTEIVVMPVNAPSATQASAYAGLRTSLRNNSITNLTDGAGLPFGPGDATFAFQFDFTLMASEMYKIAYVVPEPPRLGLVAMGLLGLAWAGRRRRVQAGEDPSA